MRLSSSRNGARRKRADRSQSPVATLRRSKRNRGPSTTPNSARLFRLHTLGEDGSFYHPDEARPVPPPSPPVGDTVVHPAVATRLKPFKKYQLKVAKAIFCLLVPFSVDNLASYAQIDWFTTANALHPVITTQLNLIRQKNFNLGRMNTAKDVENLQKILEDTPDDEQQARQAMFSKVISYLEHKENRPDHIVAIVKLAAERRAKLSGARAGGVACRKSATFIRVERLPHEEVVKLMGKPMVESHELAGLGLRAGALKVKDGEEQYVVLEKRGFHRICAPASDATKRATAVILWEPVDADDVTATGDKIIGAVVYSPEKVCDAFSPEQEYNETEIRITQDLLIAKDNIDRARLVNGGKMAKSMGAQSTYGIPYFQPLPDDPKVYDGNVKIPLPSLEPFLLARHEAFLSGLLGEFAALRMAAAEKVGLINRAGMPNMSTFATYGYSASAHVDQDACPTSGWVTHRPASLHRYTSNFVWASHGVIAELAPNAFWYWRAKEDAHGTTVHLDDLQNSALSYSKGYIKKNPNGAQWTRVSVLSDAVSRAHERGNISTP